MLCAHSHLTLCNPMDSKPPCPRPPCPSPSPRVCPSSCPLHQWRHPAISSSDTLFSFCLQSFPVSGTFPMSWLFTSGDPNTGVSASASALPMNIQDWFPLRKCSLFQMAQMVKKSARNAGDLGSIPVLRRSPGGGHGNPLQYSCLENPMDRGAWRATVHGVTKTRTQLSD